MLRQQGGSSGGGTGPTTNPVSIAQGGTGSATAPAQSLFGNASSSTGAPSYQTSPVLSGSLQANQSGTTNTTPDFLLGTSGVSGSVQHVYNGASGSYLGIFNSATGKYYALAPQLPAATGVAALAGYFNGMAVGGTTNSGNNPIFGVLTPAQGGSGVGSTAFGVTDTNVVTTFNTKLDDGTGNVVLTVAGKGITLKSGSNARIGTGTLSGGTLVVANTSVTANTRIFLTDTTSGALTNVGSLTVVTSAGVGFTVNSTNVLDASTFNWILFESS